MTNLRILVPVAVLSLACGSQVQEPPTPPPDQAAPEFQGGGQQGVVGDPVYPGPYGLGIGSVIPNYKFFGYPRANVDKTVFVEIYLADFWNPTGTDVYPAGSPYGEGTPKPKALVLDRSAVWCGPCQYEASQEIPPKRAAYAPNGEFFVTIDDGPTPGTAATQADLTYWVTRFNINYPAVVDPNSTLSAIVGRDAYPGNVIIRTKDMKIIEWTAGAPGPAFWAKFEDVMAGKPVLPGE